ncbi:barstar family protein [Frateuria sp. GZRe14]|uniref:barstar family protein n=1 Tax=Frateuria sp. GZRe14 TaxID=3351534 RepID=UPI003EDCA5AB
MTSKVLQIDLHDAGRDGIYRVVPDDPMTLADDAARAGLRLSRIDLRECTSHHRAVRCLAQAFELALPGDDWSAITASLRDPGWLSAPGCVLVLDHADVLRAEAPDVYAALRDHLAGVAKDWYARGVPFFVFMVFPDSETLDAAIDA